MIHVVHCLGRNCPNLENGEISKNTSRSTNSLFKCPLKRLPCEAAAPCCRKRLDSIIDDGVRNSHLVIHGECGHKCSRSRSAYLWRIAGEDHDDVVLGIVEGSEHAAQRPLSWMAIRNGTINPCQR
jgi:hypothetical protein